MSMVLLFGGIPGGPELLILFVVFLFMLGIPLVVGVGLFLIGRWSATDDDEVAALRARIDELEAEMRGEQSEDDTETLDRER